MARQNVHLTRRRAGDAPIAAAADLLGRRANGIILVDVSCHMRGARHDAALLPVIFIGVLVISIILFTTSSRKLLLSGIPPQQ